MEFFKKTMIRMPFEAVIDQLISELPHQEFVLNGMADFNFSDLDTQRVSSRKYKILSVYNPVLYNEMLIRSPFEGLVVPCHISIVEVHTGDIAVVPSNPTEHILKGIDNPALHDLTREVSRRLDLIIHAIEQHRSYPDMVTSWE